jgi:hypothetical protein
MMIVTCNFENIWLHLISGNNPRVFLSGLSKVAKKLARDSISCPKKQELKVIIVFILMLMNPI